MAMHIPVKRVKNDTYLASGAGLNKRVRSSGDFLPYYNDYYSHVATV